MRAGVSTACLFPQHTEEAFYDLALGGIECAELFINADSDVTRPRVHTLQTLMDRFGITIPSVHPFACPIESMMLFGSYDRRVDDMIASGESILDLCKELKARRANRIFAIATFAFFTSGMSIMVPRSLII